MSKIAHFLSNIVYAVMLRMSKEHTTFAINNHYINFMDAMALKDIYSRMMPDRLTETVVTELRKSVKGFHLTDKTMIADCPNCEKSWRGQSYYEHYQNFFEQQRLRPSDAEIWAAIKERHKTTHASLLFHIVEADKYVCPFCASVFEKEIINDKP